MSKYLINTNFNTACSLHKDGSHRIYYNNKRKGTKLYIYHGKYDYVLKLLKSFGYEICDETIFNNYFKIIGGIKWTEY